MSSVLVFTGRNAADSTDFRWQLLRVPEISQIFKEAQKALDLCESPSLNLISFMQSETNEYLANMNLRDLCAKLVQIGLYRRYEKSFQTPTFIIGDAGEVSASAVCFHKMTVLEMVMKYNEELLKNEEEKKSLDFLVGQKLEVSKVYQKIDGEYVVISAGKDVSGLIEEIRKDYLLDQVIALGSLESLELTEGLVETGVVESVVMDPLLSWIIPFLRPHLTISTAV